MEEVRAWKPICCNKAYLIKGNARKHERMCPHNPENRACATCGHNSKERETVYVPPYDGNPGTEDYERDYYWCDYYEKEISKWEVVGKTIFPRSHCERWISKENNNGRTNQFE